jgi:ribosome maturation factor RimP
MALEIEKVREIADRVAAGIGVEVVELDLRGGGKSRMLRVFIDKPEGVTHEDCANFSHEFGTIVDVEDAIPGGAYLLEVSSPGLDRKLTTPKDFQRFQNSLVKLMTFEPVNGNRHFEGRLINFENGRLTVDIEAVKARRRAVRQRRRADWLRLSCGTSRRRTWFRKFRTNRQRQFWLESEEN